MQLVLSMKGGPSYKFELVEEVPLGYRIWNVGRNMPDGYLPFCRLASRQPFAGGRTIDTESLKVIKTLDAQVILAAVGGGESTPSEMEEYIRKHAKTKPGTWAFRQVERMRLALPCMRKIKGWDITKSSEGEEKK